RLPAAVRDRPGAGRAAGAGDLAVVVPGGHQRGQPGAQGPVQLPGGLTCSSPGRARSRDLPARLPRVRIWSAAMTYPGGEHDPYSGQPVPHYYGSGSTYQGLGAFEQPPRRSRTALVAGVVTALVLAGGGAAAYFLTTGGDESPEAAPATSTSAAPTTAQSSSPPPTSSLAPPTTQSAGSSRVKAVVEGWAPVFSAREGAAFDVSEDWTVEDPGVIAGFEDDSGIRTAMHGVA